MNDPGIYASVRPLSGTDPRVIRFAQQVDPYVTNLTYKKWDPLRRYNFILFIIHILIIVALLIYFARINDPDKQANYVNLDLFNHAFKINSTASFFEVISKKVLTVTEDSVIALIITFFAVTAGFHLLYALNPCNVYLDAIRNGNNFMRWIEYGVSATIMIVIISLLSGVKDIKNYLLLVVSSVAIMSTGQWFETATGKSKWIPILVGFAVMAGVFATIFTSFKERLDEAKTAGFRPPAWLYGVVWVMFGFYASFGFVPVAQMVFGGNYRKYEYAYLTLSLVSKASLGLLVAVGFGQRTQADNPS